MRKPTYVLFVFLLAAESCPLDQCGSDCKSTTTSSTIGILGPGDDNGDAKYVCLTCDHSASEATWSPSSAGGFIELKMHGECASGGVIGTELKSTAAPSAGTVSISNVPPPAECLQASAPVSWFVKVTNKSEQPIGDVVSRITCPTSQGSGAAAGPSRVGIK